MHSWELVQQKQQSCLIATLLAPPLMVSVDWALSFNSMEKPPIHDVIRLTGLPFGEGRTQAAYECLNRGHQWLFFLDCDILAPANTITRLLSHRLPIVSALYHQKFPTWTGMEVKYMPCIFNEGRDAQGNPVRVEVSNFQYGQLVEVAYAPAGAILVHRSVFERMLAAGIKRFYEWTMTSENPHGRCVPAGQEVFGGSPIETMEVGETIWDCLGRKSEVQSTFNKQYEGEIITITPKCLKIPFSVTPEHQVLTMERPTCRYSKARLCRVRRHCQINRHSCETPVWLENKPKWVRAEDLRPGMYLAFPKVDGHSVKHRIDLKPYLEDILKLDSVGKTNRNSFCKNVPLKFKKEMGIRKGLPRFLEVTPEFLELAGLYVAEGYASVTTGLVSLTFGPHELDLAEETATKFESAFGIRPWIRKGDHAWCVNVKRKALAILFTRWFGKGARNKVVPDWIMGLPSKDIGYFLKGLWRGDGSTGWTSVGKYSFWLNTSSKTLALQVVALLIKCGIHVGVFEYRAEKAYNRGAPMYRVTLYGGSPKFGRLIGAPKMGRDERKKQISHSFFYDKKFWFPVGAIERQSYHGIVYDLTVEPNNSYILGPAIVHNSEDFEFCARARACGYKVMVDTGLACIHEAQAKVDMRGLSPKI